MKSVLYLGCPAPERADAEKLLGAVDVSVEWAENATIALNELQHIERQKLFTNHREQMGRAGRAAIRDGHVGPRR